jgi:hypothetical protein
MKLENAVKIKAFTAFNEKVALLKLKRDFSYVYFINIHGLNKPYYKNLRSINTSQL